jgi:HAD superfamily hydrolase (TIGR01509 family)
MDETEMAASKQEFSQKQIRPRARTRQLLTWWTAPAPVVTSGQNCTAVLKAAKLDHCFDVQVDGNVSHAQHLSGKPAPDTYSMAAKLLGVEPVRAVVIEDALSGVEAGAAGRFGLVIGVARKGRR